MADAGSTLIAHVDTSLVTRAQLAALPAVVETNSFKPVAHIELVEMLEKALRRRNITIEREQFAIKADGSRLFGTLDLSMTGIIGSCASLGIRTANDKSMSIQMIAGLRIFVCDNMCFNGDLIALQRRHTSGLNLLEELQIAVMKYEQHFINLKTEAENLKSHLLADTEAKAMIYDVFTAEAMPTRFFKAVGAEYFNPRHEEFEPRNAWSLHNSFTEVAKAMPLNTRIDAIQQVGRYFGLVSGN